MTTNKKTSFQSEVDLPPASWAFGRVILKLDIHDGGKMWDEWDRNGHLYVIESVFTVSAASMCSDRPTVSTVVAGSTGSAVCSTCRPIPVSCSAWPSGFSVCCRSNRSYERFGRET